MVHGAPGGIRRRSSTRSSSSRRATKAAPGPTGAACPKTTKLTEWRFRSPYRDVIETLAGQYGGKCIAFHDDSASPKDQWEVFTEANEIDVIVLPNSVSLSYEMWSHGGCVRRCDGRTVQVPQKAGPDDYELVEKPCLCVAQGERSCDPKTRLSVVLPNVAFRGSWLLESKSHNAMLELPGMADLISDLGGGGMKRAKLSIEQRSKKTITGTRQFIVPVLSVAETAMELTAGMGAVTALANPQHHALGVATARAALEAGESGYYADVGQAVHDAELIDDDLLDLEAKLREAGKFYGLDPDAFLTAMTKAVNGNRERLRNALARMADDSIAPIGIKDGRVQWRT
jgi:hypothetical protein